MRRRGRRLILLALVAAALVAGLSRLRLDTDILNLLPPGAPGVAGLRLWQRHFAGAQELLITVRGAEAEAAARAAEAVAVALRARPDLVRRAGRSGRGGAAAGVAVAPAAVRRVGRPRPPAGPGNAARHPGRRARRAGNEPVAAGNRARGV